MARYDINEFIHLLRAYPSAYQFLGMGKSCLALVREDKPGLVLLLEGIGDHKTSSDIAHLERRAIGRHRAAVFFSKRFDDIIASGLKRVFGRTYVHSNLVNSTVLGQPVAFPLRVEEIGTEHVYQAMSARLVKRVDGRPLHYAEFSIPHTPLFHSSGQSRHLARHLAEWLFTLHTDITTQALAAETDPSLKRQSWPAAVAGQPKLIRSHKLLFYSTKGSHGVNWLSKLLASNPAQDDAWLAGIRVRLRDSGAELGELAEYFQILQQRIPLLAPHDLRVLNHTDLHPGNILVDETTGQLRGVCDWMSAGFDYRAVDFAGFAMARGLLPRLLTHYTRLKRQAGIGPPLDHELVYGVAASRVLFALVQTIKNDYGAGREQPILWRQAVEQLEQLARLQPTLYRPLYDRIMARGLPALRGLRQLRLGHSQHGLDAG